ncbi:8259_t:CDS:1 [Ambispora gerdemannii]|uniref:DNA 3'-5' helicase n=1 Tax=Ambispora gerdemannii TaxID=144530 RepID=A0A9N9E3E6_9GLOM|nr:8259_t:CDS:1 [Ambispora gerdemannii]
MTATLTRDDARDIVTKIGLDFSHVEIIHDITFKQNELVYEVIKKKTSIEENLQGIITQIKSISGRAIVYCATQKDCYEIADLLRIKLEDIDGKVGVYHRGVPTGEKKCTVEKWKKQHIKVMVAINDFGLGINIPDVRLVVYYTMSQNLSNYIQETGKAGRNGSTAKYILLYARRDVRILYNIVAGKRESSLNDVVMENEEIRQVYLRECQKKIWEMIFFCETKFECRQSALTHYQNWKENNIPPSEPSCERCDACQLRAKETLITRDMKMSALRLLKVVEALKEFESDAITAKDVVDVFCKSKNTKLKYKELEIYQEERDTVKLTIDEANRLFNDLVIRGMVLTDIILR